MEIESRKSALDSDLTTIYFGGGSPSILAPQYFNQLYDSLQHAFDLSQLVEATLETNPDDHTPENLRFWKSLGINRLSIGIQSFIERDLQWMNRAHSSHQALNCVSNAKRAGFKRLTIDLIYGIPNQSLSECEANIDKAIELEVDHISAYCLTVEEKTALAHRIKKGLDKEKSHDEIETEFHLLQRKLERAGFIQYELSNFSKPNCQAVHNANYWSGKPYLGFGPSAHSFDGKIKRSWNVANNTTYIKSVVDGTQMEYEDLTEKDRVNEQIMTGLRTAEGLSSSTFPEKIWRQIHQNLEELTPPLKHMIEASQNEIKIDPKHWLMSDALIRELMIE